MSNWWAEKLGVEPSTSSTPPVKPPTQEIYRPSPQSPNTPVSYDAERDQVVIPKKARSTREQEHCPACDSGNYMSNALNPQMQKRCYDCGYPITQSGTGVGGTGSGSPTIAAKQRGQNDGFNMNIIVDRIG